MVTATDCWSESVLGFSDTAACAVQNAHRAAARAAGRGLRVMATSFRGWRPCCKRRTIAKGLTGGSDDGFSRRRLRVRRGALPGQGPAAGGARVPLHLVPAAYRQRVLVRRLLQ